MPAVHCAKARQDEQSPGIRRRSIVAGTVIHRRISVEPPHREIHEQDTSRSIARHDPTPHHQRPRSLRVFRIPDEAAHAPRR